MPSLLLFAEQNGALDAECAMNLLFEANGSFILSELTVKMQVVEMVYE